MAAMTSKLFLNNIYVKKSPRQGYGVFAGKKLRKGELIEECYFILSKGSTKAFDDFYFDAKGKNALFLGRAILVNLIL